MSRPISTNRSHVCAMYQRGVNPADIAREFGVKPSSVRMMLTRAGIYRPDRVGQAGTRSVAAKAKVEAQKAQLAEHVAEGGSITGWATANGITEGWTWQLWRKIRQDLGAQAI